MKYQELYLFKKYMKKFYFSNLLLAIIDSVYEVSTYRKPGSLESFKGFSLMRDLEDLYGPLVTSADNTGRSPDPAVALGTCWLT